MTFDLLRTMTFDSEAETQRFAAAFGRRLSAGHVILLEGDIGAGKTYFCRALIQALLSEDGTIEDVPSPTFTLVQVYETSKGEIWHSDLYRLTHPDEIEELGLIDAFETSICLVEWPDRLGELLPQNALRISFSTTETEDERRASFYADAPYWADLLPFEEH